MHIPDVCVNDVPVMVNVDFAWNAGDLPVCVLGEKLKAKSTPVEIPQEGKEKK